MDELDILGVIIVFVAAVAIVAYINIFAYNVAMEIVKNVFSQIQF